MRTNMPKWMCIAILVLGLALGGRAAVAEDQAIPTSDLSMTENGPLRLYCLRRSSLLLIVGYGGPKFTGTYQEEPVLDEAVKKLQTIDALLDKRQKSREIIINPNTGAMDGDLVFTADDWE